MSATIYYEPDELWDFYRASRPSLLNAEELIAENTTYEVEVYMTVEDVFPSIVVVEGGEPISDYEVCTEEECREIADMIYEQYIVDDLQQEGDLEEMLINEREDELRCAFEDLLFTIYKTKIPSGAEKDKIVRELIEHTVDRLAQKYPNIPIYRPMRLEDEDGEEFFEEYPYECIIFEEEKSA